MSAEVPAVVTLATQQLVAYNNRDIDAFCACYADDVVVLDESGAETLVGIDAFRQRYGPMFAGHILVEGHITGRVVSPPHLVEKELWRRQKDAGSDIESGEVLVRYTERDGKIAVVQFFR